MRVIAGQYRGRRLKAPPGASTRPTSDRVREALSRGAAEAVFVESDRRAAAVIRANLAAVGEPNAQVRVENALAYLARTGGELPYGLVFADPPYSSAPRMGEELSRLLPPLLTDESLTVTESDKRAPLELALPLADERVYGDTRIAIHRGR